MIDLEVGFWTENVVQTALIANVTNVPVPTDAPYQLGLLKRTFFLLVAQVEFVFTPRRLHFSCIRHFIDTFRNTKMGDGEVQ